MHLLNKDLGNCEHIPKFLPACLPKQKVELFKYGQYFFFFFFKTNDTQLHIIMYIIT